jgi:hypothetical protein
MDLVDDLDHCKDLHAPLAAPALAGSGVQFGASHPVCNQFVPALAGGAQTGFAHSEARPAPPAPTPMDQIGDEDSDVQSWESGLFDLAYLDEALQDGERAQTPDQTNLHFKVQPEIHSADVTNIPLTPVVELASSSEAIALPVTPTPTALVPNSNRLETSAGPLTTSWTEAMQDGDRAQTSDQTNLPKSVLKSRVHIKPLSHKPQL